MATIGSTNLTLVNDRPEVEVLWNGRYRLTFFCDNGNGQTDWYNENKGEIFPAFGALQSVQLGEEGAGDWIAPDGSVYDNMRLVEAGTPFVPSVGKHYVKLVYETLTDAWVQEKDDTTNNDLNGLERVTRVSVALPDTAYTGVIGTTTITKDGTTLYLGKSEVDETDAKWTLTEEWFEHGELSRNEDLEDAKGAISITNLGDCPVAPAGFTAVKTSEDNTQGLPTCTVTFYEDDSELSRSNDYVGSQLAETVEVFNPTVQPTPTNVSAVLGNQVVSSVDGIPTTRYTFLKPSILRLSQELVGGSTRVQVSAFDKTEAQVDAALSEVTENHILVSQREEDYEGIKTSEFVYEISDFEVRNQTESGLQIIQQTELSINNLTDGVIGVTNISDSGSTLYLSSEEIDNGNAIKTRVRKWLEAGKLSESEPLTGADRLRVKTVVWQMIQGADPTGYVASATKIDNIGGFKTITVSYYLSDDLSTSYSYATTVPFSMPGTVDFRTTSLASGAQNKMLDVTPDIRTICSAEITESYTTNPTVDVSSLYQPNFWTSVIIEGVGLNYQPFSSSSTYKNHIALSSGTSSTGPLIGTEFIQGNRLFGGTTGYIRIDGPEDDPAGTTITINIDVQPVFRLLDGTQYYKKVVTKIDVPVRGS